FKSSSPKMKRSKFFKLLQTLSNLELQAFAGYLKHQNKGLGLARLLFEHIASFAPDYTTTGELESEYFIRAFLKVTPNSASRKRLYNELSKLSMALKEFLLWQRFQQQTFEKNFMLAEILRERKMDGEAENALALARKSLVSSSSKTTSSSPTVDHWHFLKLLKYHHFLYYSTQSFQLTAQTDELQAAMSYLDLFYASSKLKYSCELKSREHILNEQHSIFLLEELQTQLPAVDWSGQDAIQLYQQSLALILNGSEEGFETLFQSLKVETNTLTSTDKKIILTYLLNFCISRVREGHSRYMDIIFQVYAFAAAKELLLDRGIIASTRFNNIVDAACKIGQFAWIEQFIDQYTTYLPPDTRSETIRIAQALVHFTQGDYGATLVQLRDGRFKNMDHSFRARWLTICCFCALKEIKSLQAACDAARQYLKRNQQINRMLIKATQNLIVIVNQISKYQYKRGGKKGKKRLLDKLSQLHPIVYKMWLEQQIRQL
ncbi:MAG: hypothetical protein AAGD05_15560, partial [Bacteroidota bacterium]